MKTFKIISALIITVIILLFSADFKESSDYAFPLIFGILTWLICVQFYKNFSRANNN